MRPIRLDLKPSRWLAAILAGAGIGASLILLYMPLSIWLKLALMLLVLASTTYHVMDALLRLPWSLIALELDGKGELHVMRRDEEKQQVRILPSSVVLPLLTLLNFQVEGNIWRRHMLITPDRVDPEAYRQLRVWLRWSGQAISDAGAAGEV